MENYNRLISSKMLGNVENMIGEVPQPTMFGGKRQRDFVLPSSTDYSYPASLSVGHLGTSGMPKTLGAAFWTDFGETNFLQDAGDDPVTGGAYHMGATGEVYRSNQLPSKLDTKLASKIVGGKKLSVKKLFKGVTPIAKELGMELAKEGIKQGVKEGFKQQGGKMSIKKLLKGAAPVAKDFGMILAKEGIKEGVKQGAKGGRVTKEFFEAEKQIFPKGKKALQEFLKGAGYGSESSSDEECEGGVLLRDVPSQFHSSVYPPALQSYTAGKDAYGKGRAKGGARPKSARGAIVSEIMKKHGLSLPEASKYVKQHNLY